MRRPAAWVRSRKTPLPPSWRSIVIGNSSSRRQKLSDEVQQVAAAWEKVAANARCSGGLEIRRAVADQKRSCSVDRPFGEQLLDHAWSRLAQIRGAAIALDGALGMVRAEFDAVDMRAALAKLQVHPVVEIVHVVFAVEAARDARLIGHEEHEIYRIVQPAHRFARAFDPADLVASVNVARVLVQHAVAVEKRGGPPQDGGNEGLRALEVLGDPDIDERSLDDTAVDQARRRQSRQNVALERAGCCTDLRQEGLAHEIDAGVDRLVRGPGCGESPYFRAIDDHPSVTCAGNAAGKGHAHQA